MLAEDATSDAVGLAPATRLRGWRAGGLVLALPALLLLCAFFVIPVGMLALRSVADPHPGLGNYADLLGSLSFWTILFNTFLVSTIVTVTALLIGFPVAWLLVLLPRGWSRLLFAIIILSMWTNLLTRTFGWMVLLQSTGVINRALMAAHLISAPLPLVNNLTGITIGMTYIMLPFIIMPLHATLKSIDPAILRAASVCGARRSQVFFFVLLPACRNGIASGCLMVFVMSLGYFVTPSLLGSGEDMMLAEWIAQLIQSLLNWGLGGAAALILLAITLGLYALQIKFLNPMAVMERGR
jgi:putative spermidine/putrescine transport system permease protein